MHNALMIPEVLHSIIDCLVEDTLRDPESPTEDADNAGRQALAVLARTCRTFSEPALDALWYKLHSLRPFLLCSPTKASYVELEYTPLVRALLVIGRAYMTIESSNQLPFDEEEWNIVSRYIHRIHELAIVNDTFSVTILQALWFHTTPLLSNLRKLFWAPGEDKQISLIRSLLSPSLVHLHISIDEGNHTFVLAFLESYPTLCPNLESLYFNHSSSFPHVTDAISRAITRLPKLEVLHCPEINRATVVHVIQSPSLKKFSSRLTNHQPDALRRLADSGGPGHVPFRNLRILGLQVDDLSSIVPYFKPQDQPIEEVSLYFHIVPTAELLGEFLTVLSSATRRKTLRWIKLSTWRTNGGRSPQPVDFRLLSPLSTLNLHELTLNIQNLITLNDDELVQLIQGFPELETLSFNQCSMSERLPSLQLPTLRGLLLLLARCPRLHSLGMCIDARNVPSLSKEESAIRNTAIKTLSISWSPIQEPVTPVAQFLADHLPSLITIMRRRLIYPGQDSYERLWKMVDHEVGRIRGRSLSPGWDLESYN